VTELQAPAIKGRGIDLSRTVRSAFVRKVLTRYGVVIALIVLLIIAAIWTPDFYSATSLRNTTRAASVLGLVALGQFLVLMVRGVDLSVGPLIAFSAVLIADRGPGLPLGLFMVVGLAVLVGLMNSFFVVRRRVPAFVATFGMLIVVEGLRQAYTKGSASGSVPSSITQIGRNTLFGMTYSVYVVVALMILVAVFLYRTRTGRKMVMTGSNPEMAQLSGVPTGLIVTGAFVASALLATLAGFFLAASTGYVDRFIGRGTDLDSITAALLGGARFNGGEGSIVGVVAGCLLLSSIFTVIVLLGWRPELQLIAKGAVLIGALAVQSSLRSSSQ
jgi:ribose transport system permease protein